MFKTDRDSNGTESVSPLALEIMDALRIKLLECLLVLQMLPAEASLNFDELADEIVAAHRGCQQAFQAASLMHQGAKLDERWGDNVSRPKAVFARHRAAVERGAQQLRPLPVLCDEIERRLWQLPALDHPHDVVGPRPKCTATVATTGNDCTNVAIYLGAGLHGAHCYSHATSNEREQYRAHQEAVSARQSQAHRELLELQRSVGQCIAAQWIARCDQRPKWVDSVVST